jgi:hypothetical protein
LSNRNHLLRLLERVRLESSNVWRHETSIVANRVEPKTFPLDSTAEAQAATFIQLLFAPRRTVDLRNVPVPCALVLVLSGRTPQLTYSRNRRNLSIRFLKLQNAAWPAYAHASFP